MLLPQVQVSVGLGRLLRLVLGRRLEADLVVRGLPVSLRLYALVWGVEWKLTEQCVNFPCFPGRVLSCGALIRVGSSHAQIFLYIF